MPDSSVSQSLIDWLPPLLMGVGVVLLLWLVVLALRRRGEQRREEYLSLQATLEQIQTTRHEVEDARARVGELIGGMQRYSMRLDQKTAELQILLAQADDCLKALKQANSGASLDAPPRDQATSSPNAAVENKPAASTSDRDTLDPLTRAVYNLADAGRPPVEIARELDEQVGKVELILALRSM